jgi:hypothetical protein
MEMEMEMEMEANQFLTVHRFQLAVLLKIEKWMKIERNRDTS